jgi:hypothetical protein
VRLNSKQVSVIACLALLRKGRDCGASARWIGGVDGVFERTMAEAVRSPSALPTVSPWWASLPN